MIPESVNWIAVLDELKAMDMPDADIDLACGFTSGYTAQIRCGNVKAPSFEKGAALFNLLDAKMGRAK